MHCKACNTNLTDFEATRKYTEGSYISLCNVCFSFISDEVDSNIRFDLMTEDDSVLVKEIEELYLDIEPDIESFYDDRES